MAEDGPQYADSPYVTQNHDLLIRDRTLTVAQKFVDDKESEVSDSLRLIPLFSDYSGVVGAAQHLAYVNKLNFLIAPIIKKNSFLDKTTKIVTLMSALVEQEDNHLRGGKDVLHPAYLFSRFIPQDSETSHCCVFRIDIRPPKDPTNLLEHKYDRFKELLAHHGVTSKLVNYNGAMSKANWIRKLLVVYVKFNVNDNNAGRFEIVPKFVTGEAVVDYVSFRVHYGPTETMPTLTNDAFVFLPAGLSVWCRNAMKWVAKILEDKSEREFKRSYLYKKMQAPPMLEPDEPDSQADGGTDHEQFIAALLRRRPKRKKQLETDQPPVDDESGILVTTTQTIIITSQQTAKTTNSQDPRTTTPNMYHRGAKKKTKVEGTCQNYL